jgi:rod shape-determining protein MreC
MRNSVKDSALYAKQGNAGYWVAAGTVIILFYLHIVYGLLALLWFYLSTIFYPLLFMLHFAQLAVFRVTAHLNNTEQLQQELALVKQERDSLHAELIELKAVIPYAQQVDLLHLAAQVYSSVKCVAVAQVIMKHFADNQHFVLISAGSNQQVKVDMVVVHNRLLVGRVVAVYPWHSKVAVITDKSVKIPVFVGDKAIAGVYEGQNGQEPMISYVNQLDMVQEGDLIISSGQGLIFPYGFAVGTLTKNSKNQLKVSFFTDIKDLRYCTVVAKVAEG